MNFILKFLDKTTNYANKHAVQRAFDILKTKLEGETEMLNHRIDSWFDSHREHNLFMMKLDQRIKSLEDNISKPKVVLYETKHSTIQYTATDAIMDLLKNSNGNKLHYSIIYDKIKSYNLINKDVSFTSVKSTLYGLARKGKIELCDGKEAGIFFIKEKKGR
jgi:hypothetical protein